MNLFDLLILAVVQGIAEFLPISSSGHLVLFGKWLGIEKAQGSLNIMLHAGTLGSIVVFYFSRILRLLEKDRRVIPLLIVGTIPAVVIGLYLKKYHESILVDPWIAASMLLVTGGILIASYFLPKRDGIEYSDAGYSTALLIGVFQAFAILPGISRSGSTIFAGQLFGLKRESAGTFSFLLAIPVIAGAVVLELKDMLGAEEIKSTSGSGDASIGLLFLGAFVSFVVGYFSLIWLVAFIQKGKFHWFAAWCIPFGIFALVMLVLG